MFGDADDVFGGFSAESACSAKLNRGKIVASAQKKMPAWSR
jgi:hypothetical protein